MTLEKEIRNLLESYGMWDTEKIDAVIARAKAAPIMSVYADRWGKTDLPDAVIAAAWMSVRHIALEYIDENCPDVWFRREFVD